MIIEYKDTLRPAVLPPRRTLRLPERMRLLGFYHLSLSFIFLNRAGARCTSYL